jgi:hypothetical protein
MPTARAPQLMPKHLERLFIGPDGKMLEVPLIKGPSAPPPLKRRKAR